MFKLLVLAVLVLSVAVSHGAVLQVFKYPENIHQLLNNPTDQEIFKDSEDNHQDNVYQENQVFHLPEEYEELRDHEENNPHQVSNLGEEDILVPVEALPPQTVLRVRRQAFGGFSSFPSGGFNQQAGYRGSVFNTPTKDLSAWGSLSQSGVARPLMPVSVGPITYSGGADFRTASGSRLSGSFSHADKLGGTGTLSGNLNLLNTPKHNLNAFASHTQGFDTHLRRQGPGSTTLGTNYAHSGGTELFLSGTRTPGQPNAASVGASVPVFKSNDGNTKVVVGGQSNFRAGAKPDHQVGVTLTSQFRK